MTDTRLLAVLEHAVDDRRQTEGGEADLPAITTEPRLRPMSSAPTTGPVVEILVATTDRAGCNGWLIAHYADGGGEDQPRFRGWFYWTGFDFRQIDSKTLIGWLRLPSPVKRRKATP